MDKDSHRTPYPSICWDGVNFFHHHFRMQAGCFPLISDLIFPSILRQGRVCRSIFLRIYGMCGILNGRTFSLLKTHNINSINNEARYQ
jgi:hypothetical protein